jgi:hypothetical protein
MPLQPRIAMVILTLKAKHDHLQKVASTRDHVKAISEFVWNALDADATHTSVEFVRNVLGGLERMFKRDADRQHYLEAFRRAGLD